MSSVLKQIPRLAIFLAGAGVATVALQRRKTSMDPAALDDVKSTLEKSLLMTRA